MKTISLFIPILMCFLFLFVQCQGENGEPGPKGDKGEKGDVGAKGEKGDKGANGAPGTANVIYSEWRTIQQNEWNGQGTILNTLNWSVAVVTQEIVDRGIVLVYSQLVYDDNQTRMLPFKINSAGLEFNYTIKLGLIRLSVVNPDALSLASGNKFRYVIVPGGVLSSGRISSPVNYDDYTAVKRFYSLPD